MRELATLTGRKKASLSRTLKRFAQVGIVAFEDGPSRARVRALVAMRVHLEIDLIGRHSAIAVDGHTEDAGSVKPWRNVRTSLLCGTMPHLN